MGFSTNTGVRRRLTPTMPHQGDASGYASGPGLVFYYIEYHSLSPFPPAAPHLWGVATKSMTAFMKTRWRIINFFATKLMPALLKTRWKIIVFATKSMPALLKSRCRIINIFVVKSTPAFLKTRGKIIIFCYFCDKINVRIFVDPLENNYFCAKINARVFENPLENNYFCDKTIARVFENPLENNYFLLFLRKNQCPGF